MNSDSITVTSKKRLDSLYRHGFARVAAVTLPVHLADPDKNAAEIIQAMRQAEQEGACLAVFPELSVSGYALEELFNQDLLLQQVESALALLCSASAALNLISVVGAPLPIGNRIYNCAVYIAQGKVQLITPKTYLPNYREFYEKRYFASANKLLPGAKWESSVPGAETAPVGSLPLQVRIGEAGSELSFKIGAEVCEDMWVAVPPSAKLALAGAQVLVNLSGSPASVGRARQRKLMCASIAARNQCAYIYTSNSNGESSTDLSWDGQTLIYQEEQLLAEGERYPQALSITYADINVQAIKHSRRSQGSFQDCAHRELSAEGQGLLGRLGTQEIPVVNLVDPLLNDSGFKDQNTSVDSAAKTTVAAGLATAAGLVSAEEHLARYALRPLPARFPFISASKDTLDGDCEEAYRIQVYALAQRLKAIGNAKIVIGVSGGLDSTQALIVAARAVDQLGWGREHILAFTMPGFATSKETKSNAYRLCESLGITCEEVDIRPAAQQMLKDIGHEFSSGAPVYDVTFENVQAGLRSDYLFRLANQRGGIVLGTGDLSELALGWCTYGVGDHMSHYGINAGVPKTMIQHLIRWVAGQELFGQECSQVLLDILAQEISPELIPVQEGEKIQSTQDKIGPYELHDFFLYYFLRGYSPRTIWFLAQQAWGDKRKGSWLHDAEPNRVELKQTELNQAELNRVELNQAELQGQRNEYTKAEILRWLREFVWRFFGAQFKRTAMPDGPKVFYGGGLSPRGEWRMPSDASRQAWLNELDALAQELDESV